jgi:hypothetical protein
MRRHNDGITLWTALAVDTANHTSGMIELPIDLLDHPSDLIDRVFAFAFDVLGLQTIELRVRPCEQTSPACPAHASS